MIFNNKGFTLVEILAVIVVVGILALLGIGGYSKYKEKTINESYIIISKNSATAARNYFLDNTGETIVTLNVLFNNQYLESIIDPADKSKKCSGTVIMNGSVNNTDYSLDNISYDVHLQCINYDRCIRYPGELDC